MPQSRQDIGSDAADLSIRRNVPELAKLRPNSGWPKFHEQPCRLNLGVVWERGGGERLTSTLRGGGTGRPFPC